MAYRVRIYTRDIAAMFGRTGEVGRIATRDSLDVIARAEMKVPKGGSKSTPSAARGQVPLAGAHIRRVVPRSATFSTQWIVENTSDHAAFVHDGTDGPIFPIKGFMLRLEIPGKRIQAPFVQGQRAQPWLRNAANDVLRKYGVQATPL